MQIHDYSVSYDSGCKLVVVNHAETTNKMGHDGTLMLWK
jgi:hypothetical protein